MSIVLGRKLNGNDEDLDLSITDNGIYMCLDVMPFDGTLSMITALQEFTASFLYEGWAELGRSADTDQAIWMIKRSSLTGGSPTLEQWADGNIKFDNVWDDRASLSYS